MAKQSTFDRTFNCSPETLLKVVTHPDFQVARSRALDHPAASVKEISRTDERLVFEVHCTEYAKGVTGIDKSKTEQTVTTYDWNLKTLRGSWSYEGPQGKRVKVSGDMKIDAAGDQAHLVQHFNVEVKIPLVGGKIEGLVIKGSDKFWPTFEKLISDFIPKVA